MKLDLNLHFGSLKMKVFIYPMLLGAALCSSFSLAEVFPITGGLKAGVTDVTYKGESATGYQWELNLGYKLNNHISITSGYAQTKADISTAQGVEKRFTSDNVPLALQFTLPINIGNIYARAGISYYKNTFGNEDETGWGSVGAVGINLSSIFNPGGAIEITYQDSGDASSSTILLGADIGF